MGVDAPAPPNDVLVHDDSRLSTAQPSLLSGAGV